MDQIEKARLVRLLSNSSQDCIVALSIFINGYLKAANCDRQINMKLPRNTQVFDHFFNELYWGLRQLSLVEVNTLLDSAELIEERHNHASRKYG